MKDITPLVAKYVEVRDAIKAKEAEHKAALEPYKVALERINATLLKCLNETGAESMRTSQGTVYTSTVSHISIQDRLAFLDWLVEGKHFDCLTLHASKEACESILDETGSLPPGIARRVELKANVRRA